jgi:hypothetical protein
VKILVAEYRKEKENLLKQLRQEQEQREKEAQQGKEGEQQQDQQVEEEVDNPAVAAAVSNEGLSDMLPQHPPLPVVLPETAAPQQVVEEEEEGKKEEAEKAEVNV